MMRSAAVLTYDFLTRTPDARVLLTRRLKRRFFLRHAVTATKCTQWGGLPWKHLALCTQA